MTTAKAVGKTILAILVRIFPLRFHVQSDSICVYPAKYQL